VRLLRRKVWDGRLFSDNKFKFRKQIADKLPIGSQRFHQPVSPLADFLITFTQDLADELLKGLGDCGVRNVFLVLIEFSRCKEVAMRDKMSGQLIHYRGFADP
jgi:hypothetical protein